MALLHYSTFSAANGTSAAAITPDRGTAFTVTGTIVTQNSRITSTAAGSQATATLTGGTTRTRLTVVTQYLSITSVNSIFWLRQGSFGVGSWYGVVVRGNQWGTYRHIAGTLEYWTGSAWTTTETLNTFSASTGVDYTWTVELDGGTLTTKRDGVTLHTVTGLTPVTFDSTRLEQDAQSTTTGLHIDQWAVESLVDYSADTPIQLDAIVSSPSGTVELFIPNTSNRSLEVVLDGAPAPTSVTANGTSLTAVQTVAGIGFYRYRLLNPPPGLMTVVVNGATSVASLIAVALSNVHQTTPERANNNSSGAGSPWSTSVSSATTDLVLSYAYAGNAATSAPTPTSPLTTQTVVEEDPGFYWSALATRAGATTSTTTEWSATSSTDRAVVSWSVQAALAQPALVGYSGVSATETTSLTYPVTVSGTNRLLVVNDLGSDGDVTSGVTFNGVAMTEITDAVYSGTQIRLRRWALVNPPAVTANVVITRSTGFRIVSCAEVWQNVNQTTPYGASVNATALTVAATTTAQQVLSSVAAARDGSGVFAATGTSPHTLGVQNASNVTLRQLVAGHQTATGSITATYTLAGTLSDQRVSALPINGVVTSPQLVGTSVFGRYSNPLTPTVPSGATVALLGFRHAGSGVLSATYAGSAMTLVRQVPDNTTDWRNSLFVYSGSLLSGTVNVSRLVGGTFTGDAPAAAFFAEGVDTTTPVRNSASATATSSTASVTVTSVAGDLCVAVLFYGAATAATGNNIFAQQDLDSMRYVVLSKIATSTSTSFSVTIPSTEWWMVGAALQPTVGGSSNASPTLTSNLLTSALGTASAAIGGGPATAVRGGGALLRPGRTLGL